VLRIHAVLFFGAGCLALQRVSIQRVTPGILPMLGVTAFLGSIPSEQDLGKSVADPVFISYEFWRRHFHNDPHIIGRSFFSEHTFVTVVAVLSPGFDLFGEDPPDIVDPWGVDPDPDSPKKSAGST
jgi:hypothetical protein